MSGHRLVVSVNISETRKIAVFGASPDRGTHHHFSLQNRCYVAKNVLFFLKRPLSGCKYYGALFSTLSQKVAEVFLHPKVEPRS